MLCTFNFASRKEVFAQSLQMELRDAPKLSFVERLETELNGTKSQVQALTEEIRKLVLLEAQERLHADIPTYTHTYIGSCAGLSGRSALTSVATSWLCAAILGCVLSS